MPAKLTVCKEATSLLQMRVYMKCKDKIKRTQNNRILQQVYISYKTDVCVQEMEMEVTNYTTLLRNVTFENTTELQSYLVKESDIISFITIGKYNIPFQMFFHFNMEFDGSATIATIYHSVALSNRQLQVLYYCRICWNSWKFVHFTHSVLLNFNKKQNVQYVFDKSKYAGCNVRNTSYCNSLGCNFCSKRRIFWHYR